MGNARTIAPWTDGNKRAGALMVGGHSPERSCVGSAPSKPDVWCGLFTYWKTESQLSLSRNSPDGTTRDMGKKKATTGRPRKLFGKKDSLIGAKCTETQIERFQRASEAAKMNRSDWVLAVLSREADKLLGPETKAE